MPTEFSHPAYRRDLGGGLVLRWSTAADVEGIGQLYTHLSRKHLFCSMNYPHMGPKTSQ